MAKRLLLVSGKSTGGKTHSLRNLRNPEGVMYLNFEAGKDLPFNAKFMASLSGKAGFTITDPMQVFGAFEKAETLPDCHTIVLDTMTFMMDMYEAQHVLAAPEKLRMSAWGSYAQFFKKLMLETVAKSTKNVVILAHTADILNEQEMAMETLVKVKGSLMNTGIESFFSTVVSTKKIPLEKLVKNDLLNISPREELLGFKYVFQTDITKETLNERMRAPEYMWAPEETYVDNDVQLILDRLDKFYS